MAGLTALKKIRSERNWTQEELAKKLGIAPFSVHRWETGVREPRGRLRKKLEKVTGVPFHQMLADSLPGASR